MLGQVTFGSFREFAESFLSLVVKLGWAKALTILLFFFLFGTVSYLMRSLLKAKDAEIKRLQEDNDRYRQVYLRQLDDKMGFSPPSTRLPNPKKPK